MVHIRMRQQTSYLAARWLTVLLEYHAAGQISIAAEYCQHPQTRQTAPLKLVIHEHVYVDIHIHTNIYAYTYICMYIYIYIFAFICVCGYLSTDLR